MDGVFMKLRHRLLLSVLFGLFAMAMYSSPMWWGVLFSSLAEPLTTTETSQAAPSPGWEADGVTVRFKALELLFSWLQR